MFEVAARTEVAALAWAVLEGDQDSFRTELHRCDSLAWTIDAAVGVLRDAVAHSITLWIEWATADKALVAAWARERGPVLADYLERKYPVLGARRDVMVWLLGRLACDPRTLYVPMADQPYYLAACLWAVAELADMWPPGEWPLWVASLGVTGAEVGP